jgi:hypothetical protein
MKRTSILVGMIFTLLTSAFAQTSITYQGFLKQNGSPANGTFNMVFRLFAVETGGTALQSSPATGTFAVEVFNGSFTQELSFNASRFTGADRFLEIEVNGTILSPRIKITSVPYSIFSQRTRGISVDGDGNIGIGTTTPTSSLHIAAPIPVLTLQDSDSSSQQVGYISLQDNTGAERGYIGYGSTATPHAYFVNNRAGGNIILGTAGGNPRLTVASNGNVGIGTQSPNFKLDVQASGIIAVSGKTSSTVGTAVYGEVTASTGTNFGVWGESDSVAGTGVFGQATASSGSTVAVRGENFSTSGIGVEGLARASSGATRGGFFRSDSPGGIAVSGFVPSNSGLTIGVKGQSSSTNGVGVYGFVSAGSGVTKGVLGECLSSNGHAVYAAGRFAATGTKSFQMDHPLQPETHYLNHFCTEGAEPLNAYSGNVITDDRGYATVTLPAYFESVNQDFRYQLTVINEEGTEFVQAMVVQKIRNNRFVIRTSKPNMEVSWRVEAVRNDRWIQQYGFQTEQEKPAEHQGKYLNPELFGQPKEKGINYSPEQGKLEK